jgi:TonB-dependent starch-binding outer membrane protein SusC
LVENILTYDGKFGRNNVNVIVGQTFEHHQDTVFQPKVLVCMNHIICKYKMQMKATGGSYESENLLASYISRVNYNFDDKYLFSATVRRDAISQLSQDNRWGWFPSVSAGWRIERENFFPVDVSTINLFKIRGSYGELGNNTILTPYGYMDGMQRNDYTYSFGNNKVTGSAISNYVNPYILWEKKKTIDYGLDLAMFNNQMEFTFGYYKSTSEDLLYSVASTSQCRCTNATVIMNAATMVNSGLEFLVTYRNRNRAVKYDITTNLSTLNNEGNKTGRFWRTSYRWHTPYRSRP